MDQNEDDKERPFVVISIVVSILIVVLWLGSYFVLSYLPEKAKGTVGDMFGVINSLFSGLALAGIILTILLQRKELKYQREELRDTRKEFQTQNETLKIQRFENTFFHLLDQHHQIVNAIDFTYHSKKKREPLTLNQMWKNADLPVADLESITITGRDVFRYKYNKLKEKIKVEGSDFLEIYLKDYNEAKADFGHYFRNLYRIIKIIDETDFFYDSNKVNEDEIFKIKYRYATILRAQISDYELAWVFYNCLSENGREKFKPLIEKYSFFNNLPEELIATKIHLNLYNVSAYGTQI